MVPSRRENRDTWQDGVCMTVHDLRNYLNCIHGYGELLLENQIEGFTKSNLAERVMAISLKADALLADLLQSTGLQKAGSGVPGQECVLGELVEDSASFLLPLFRKKEVSLEFDIAPERTILALDKDNMTRAVTNLLSNSLKFTPAGGEVTVMVRRREARAYVGVRDSGIGLLPEHISRIFEKFYQVQPHNHGSLGLGLYIARQIVLGHGGELHAESAGLGKGSFFWFYLPLEAHA